MKVEFEESQIKMTFETAREQQGYENWVAQAKEVFPKLFRLWSLEPPVLEIGELLDKVRREDWVVRSFRRCLESETPNPVFIRQKLVGEPGRPVSDRSIIVAFRLLCGAPYDLVLEREKEWRIKEYLRRVRDKNVSSVIRKARHKALRDASNCLHRAQESTARFLERHPEFILPLAVLHHMVRESYGQSQEALHGI